LKKICPLCEHENEEDARFCTECNEPLYNLEEEYKGKETWIPDEPDLGKEKSLPTNLEDLGLTNNQIERLIFVFKNYFNDHRKIEKEIIALLLGSKWQWSEFDGWHHRFTELGYFPYMWASVQNLPSEKIPEAVQVLDTFANLSLNARRLLVGNNVVNFSFQATRAIEDIGRAVGMMQDETVKVIEELREANLAKYPLEISEKLQTLKVDDLKSICEEYNLQKTGKKADIVNRISQNITPDELKGLLPSEAQRDTARIGLSLPIRARNYIGWNIEKIKLLSHTLEFSFDSLRSIENFKQMNVKKYEIIGVKEDPCPICATKNNKKFDINDLDNIPPFHPGCRCCMAPVI